MFPKIDFPHTEFVHRKLGIPILCRSNRHRAMSSHDATNVAHHRAYSEIILLTKEANVLMFKKLAVINFVNGEKIALKRRSIIWMVASMAFPT